MVEVTGRPVLLTQQDLEILLDVLNRVPLSGIDTMKAVVLLSAKLIEATRSQE